MDLTKILVDVENKEGLIKLIEQEIGKNYVPRKEFNEKNDSLKEKDKALGDLNTAFEKLTAEGEGTKSTIDTLNKKLKDYELSSLRTKIAYESGLPYELSSRLKGEDEESIRGDAETLAGLIKRDTKPAPLKETESLEGEGKDSAYKELLSRIKGD